MFELKSLTQEKFVFQILYLTKTMIQIVTAEFFIDYY